MTTETPLERPLPAFRHIPAFRYDSPPKKVAGKLEIKCVSDAGAVATDAVEAENVALSQDKSDCKVGDFGFFPPWALDTESLSFISSVATREPSDGDGDEAADSSKASICGSSKGSDGQCCDVEGDEEVEMELPPLLQQDLEDAYDEAVDAPLPGSAGQFRWSSMKDAARAAWAGGTDLLRYGEILPRGAAKALARLREGAPNRPALAIELGMGRGRLAMQTFLSGASVIGVEFASERYHRAVAASERLAHRRPEVFSICKAQAATGPTVRLQNILPGRWGGALYEARRGDFFHALSEEEMETATLVIMQVQIPVNSRKRVCDLLSHTSDGCRLLSRVDLTEIWQPDEIFPFKSLGRCRIATSWAPVRGHDMYIWEKQRSTSSEDSESEASDGAAD